MTLLAKVSWCYQFLEKVIGKLYLKTNSTVAIVIPAYNAEKRIKKCIKSIEDQTYNDWILVVVNDGSTDNTKRIVEKFSEKDPRIILIDQPNKGAVEARKAGVLSDAALSCKWLTFCDADDYLPRDAIGILVKNAEENDADVVCGKFKSFIYNIRVKRFVPPCFLIEKPVIYDHDRIINELYISFFGVTNLPVSLFAKLYRIDVIVSAISNPPVVRFMGEDLSVTIRILPEIEKFLIIPDVVYNYRLGGGTSKFMPYMIDDFVRLFNFKKEFAIRYSVPQNWQFYMDAELLNVTKSYVQSCLRSISEERTKDEIKKFCKNQTIIEAAERLIDVSSFSDYANMIIESDMVKIYDLNKQILKTESKMKRLVKKLLVG